jgi:hypothetical protein
VLIFLYGAGMTEETPEKSGWWGRLTAGLSKSTSKISTGLVDLFYQAQARSSRTR